MKYIDSRSLLLTLIALQAFLSISAAGGVDASTAAGEGPYPPQVEGRLSNEELRTRIYSLENETLAQRDTITELRQQFDQLHSSFQELQNVGSEFRQAFDQLQSSLSGREKTTGEYRTQQSQRLERIRDEHDSDTKSIRADLGVAKSKGQSDIASLESRIEEAAKKSEKSRDRLDVELKDIAGRMTQSQGEFGKKIVVLDEQFSGVSSAVTSQSHYAAIAGVAFLVLLILLVLRIRSGRRALSDELQTTSDELRKEHVELDLKLATLLERRLEESRSTEAPGHGQEADHTLPLQVASEIHRMQKRLASFPEGIKGVKPLAKALERLQESLHDQSYEIVDLLGSDYDDGMTLQASFVRDDSVPSGESKITRVIKPQVNYQDKLIQVGEVEVSVGEQK